MVCGILILYFMEKFDQKSEKIKNVDLAFFFFFLSSFTGFTHSFFFLLTCSNIDESQIILIKNFKFINIFCTILSFLSLLVSCLFDYYKFIKKFAIFKKVGLSKYIFSIAVCLTIFLFNGFFMKILFQVKTKNDFSIAEENKYKNFFACAIINFICVFFLCIATNMLQLKARRNIFCFNNNQSKKSLIKKNEKSNSLPH